MTSVGSLFGIILNIVFYLTTVNLYIILEAHEGIQSSVNHTL